VSETAREFNAEIRENMIGVSFFSRNRNFTVESVQNIQSFPTGMQSNARVMQLF
jgi:hypothetical protein